MPFLPTVKLFVWNVPDKSKNSLAAHVVNNPARAVTDHNWDGSTFCFASDPEQYSAIHFHDDDLDDDLGDLLDDDDDIRDLDEDADIDELLWVIL